MVPVPAGNDQGLDALHFATQQRQRVFGLGDPPVQAGPLQGQHVPAQAHQGQQVFAQHVHRGHRPCDGQVEALPQGVLTGGVLGPQVQRLGVQAQAFDDRLEELHPLRQRVHQREAGARQQYGQRYAGKARAGAHVHGGGGPGKVAGQRGDAVQVVPVHGLGGVVRHPGQVHAGVGPDQHFVVGGELFGLTVAHGNAHGGGTRHK